MIKKIFLISGIIFISLFFTKTNTATGAISYTDMAATFTPTVSGAWTNWNITQTHGVPKGSVVEVMIIRNVQSDSNRNGGIRTSGSIQDRRYYIHEPEAGGITTLTMLGQVSTNGLIQYYTSTHTDMRINILGYFTAVLSFFRIMILISHRYWLRLCRYLKL